MQANHTPGPWYQDSNDETFIRAHGDEPGVCAVARVCRRGGWSEQEGNRLLIQAAPELLAALQALIALQDAADPEGLFRAMESVRARAAIAKATGGALQAG